MVNAVEGEAAAAVQNAEEALRAWAAVESIVMKGAKDLNYQANDLLDNCKHVWHGYKCKFQKGELTMEHFDEEHRNTLKNQTQTWDILLKIERDLFQRVETPYKKVEAAHQHLKTFQSSADPIADKYIHPGGKLFGKVVTNGTAHVQQIYHKKLLKEFEDTESNYKTLCSFPAGLLTQVRLLKSKAEQESSNVYSFVHRMTPQEQRMRPPVFKQAEDALLAWKAVEEIVTPQAAVLCKKAEGLKAWSQSKPDLFDDSSEKDFKEMSLHQEHAWSEFLVKAAELTSLLREPYKQLKASEKELNNFDGVNKPMSDKYMHSVGKVFVGGDAESDTYKSYKKELLKNLKEANDEYIRLCGNPTGFLTRVRTLGSEYERDIKQKETIVEEVKFEILPGDFRLADEAIEAWNTVQQTAKLYAGALNQRAITLLEYDQKLLAENKQKVVTDEWTVTKFDKELQKFNTEQAPLWNSILSESAKYYCQLEPLYKAVKHYDDVLKNYRGDADALAEKYINPAAKIFGSKQVSNETQTAHKTYLKQYQEKFKRVEQEYQELCGYPSGLLTEIRILMSKSDREMCKVKASLHAEKGTGKIVPPGVPPCTISGTVPVVENADKALKEWRKTKNTITPLAEMLYKQARRCFGEEKQFMLDATANVQKGNWSLNEYDERRERLEINHENIWEDLQARAADLLNQIDEAHNSLQAAHNDLKGSQQVKKYIHPAAKMFGKVQAVDDQTWHVYQSKLKRQFDEAESSYKNLCGYPFGVLTQVRLLQANSEKELKSTNDVLHHTKTKAKLSEKAHLAFEAKVADEAIQAWHETRKAVSPRALSLCQRAVALSDGDQQFLEESSIKVKKGEWTPEKFDKELDKFNANQAPLWNNLLAETVTYSAQIESPYAAVKEHEALMKAFKGDAESVSEKYMNPMAKLITGKVVSADTEMVQNSYKNDFMPKFERVDKEYKDLFGLLFQVRQLNSKGGKEMFRLKAKFHAETQSSGSRKTSQSDQSPHVQEAITVLEEWKDVKDAVAPAAEDLFKLARGLYGEERDFCADAKSMIQKGALSLVVYKEERGKLKARHARAWEDLQLKSNDLKDQIEKAHSSLKVAHEKIIGSPLTNKYIHPSAKLFGKVPSTDDNTWNIYTKKLKAQFESAEVAFDSVCGYPSGFLTQVNLLKKNADKEFEQCDDFAQKKAKHEPEMVPESAPPANISDPFKNAASTPSGVHSTTLISEHLVANPVAEVH